MKLMKTILGASVILLAAPAMRSATLATVPMQGGMVMPMVSYNASAGRIHVMMPTEIPQLTPLLVSHPGDGFNAADPWFDELDPSRQGASFSRRFGFVMAAETDLLPPGTQLWIRKLSGPPELKAYRYSGSEPKAMEPIFGTDGTTNARAWNGMMFHPLFTAPPGTNDLLAEFELFLVNTNSGDEVTGSASGALAFHWSNVSDGRPVLTIGAGGVVSWPGTTPTNWVLEATRQLGEPIWEEVVIEPAMAGGRNSVHLDLGIDLQRFFRMRYVR